MKKQTNKQLAGFYDKVYKKGEGGHYTKLLFGEKNNALPIDETEVLKSADWKNKTVLDVGCGTGLMAFEIAKAGAKRAVGVDFSADGIKLARETYALPNLEYRAEDFKNHKGKYDIIVSLGTVEHMDNPLSALKAMKKLLNKGGKMILTCPNWTNPRGYILQTLRFLFGAPITLADIHYLTPVEFAGFAQTLKMKLDWKTFDFNWAHGEKLLKDFERRLPNVLRDIKITGKEKEIAEFIKWIKEHILAFDHTAKWSGATGLYELQN